MNQLTVFFNCFSLYLFSQASVSNFSLFTWGTESLLLLKPVVIPTLYVCCFLTSLPCVSFPETPAESKGTKRSLEKQEDQPEETPAKQIKTGEEASQSSFCALFLSLIYRHIFNFHWFFNFVDMKKQKVEKRSVLTLKETCYNTSLILSSTTSGSLPWREKINFYL